jgi:hypothetical protein
MLLLHFTFLVVLTKKISSANAIAVTSNDTKNCNKETDDNPWKSAALLLGGVFG